jgi:capsular exopolysaccharide synthesis family protein
MELVSWNQKSSLLAESFRTTITSILFSGQDGDRPRVLVLTSASPKEGKTTTVCNLAITLAEINHRVLIIDGDMRRPRLHSVFGIDNDRGLSDLLRESTPLDAAALDSACLPTAIPGLYVMPSGGARHSASSLVHSVRLPELIRLAREKFDTVLVDTPPMVNISDARVMARFGDAVILIVRSAATTRDAALLAKRRFAEDGIQLSTPWDHSELVESQDSRVRILSLLLRWILSLLRQWKWQGQSERHGYGQCQRRRPE